MIAVSFVAFATEQAAYGSAPPTKDVLYVTMIPDEAPAEFVRKAESLRPYLEQATGMKVIFRFPGKEYGSVVSSLLTGSIDLAWLDGFTFVQAQRRPLTPQEIADRRAPPGVVPLVQREEDALFQKDFAKVSYSEAQDLTAKWVESGRVEAAAIDESIFQKLVDEKKVDPSKVRVLWTTPAYFDHNWTDRGNLDPQLIEKIRKAFLSLDFGKPEHKAILDLQRTHKFIPTSPENYRPIAKAAYSVGLLEGFGAGWVPQ